MATDCMCKDRCVYGDTCNEMGEKGIAHQTRTMSCSNFTLKEEEKTMLHIGRIVDNSETMTCLEHGEQIRHKNIKELRKAWKEHLKKQEEKHGKRH